MDHRYWVGWRDWTPADKETEDTQKAKVNRLRWVVLFDLVKVPDSQRPLDPFWDGVAKNWTW